jgi:hypothetical protein
MHLLLSEMTLATHAYAPINRFRVQLVGDKLMGGLERTDMDEPIFGYLLVRILNLDALRRMDSSGNALQAQEWYIPSWREDQFESVKRAVAEFVFVKFGGRPWTTCFHLVETSQRLGGTYRKVSLIEDVWPDQGGPGQHNASVDTSRIIDMVFDWGPNMDYGKWPVWLPAEHYVNLRPRL